GEVARVPLAAGVRVVGGDHVVQALVAQLAVVGPRADVEVDVAAAVGGRVGVTALDEGVDERDHLRDVTGRPRLVGRGEDPEQLERLGGVALVAVAQGEPVGTGLRCLAQDLVVDVGDVADEGDVVPVAAHEPAPQHVEGHGEAQVADVRGALRRQPADVHPHPTRGDGGEVALGAGCGVVELQGHGPRLTADRLSTPITRMSDDVMTTSPVHVVFEVDVLDADSTAYRDYKQAVAPLIERFGGRYLARAARGTAIEGPGTTGVWHLVEPRGA